MKTIVLATRNKDKIKELQQALAPLPIELKSAYDFPQLNEVEEDKDTLRGNALKKAEYTFQKTGIASLADDTGLEVDALGGRPGVYSARYAGEDVSYQENVDKLLNELDDVATKQRAAQFRTVVAFVTNEGTFTFEGVCPGEITKNEQGEGGFGYDPVFKPKGYGKTFAELSTKEKNSISHRAKAIEKFIDWFSF